MASRSTPRLEIRQAKLKDVRAIGDLVRRAYDDLPAYTQGEIRGQINNYPDGCFVALFDGAVVGYCASMRLDERVEPGAGGLERLGQQGLVVEGGQPARGAAMAPSLEHGAPGGNGAVLALDLARGAPADEGETEVAGLGVGEGDDAGFAEGVGLVAGEDVPDVVHVAQAARVPDDRVRGVGHRGDLARLLRQTLGGEAARLAEIAVGGADGARPEARQPGRVVELVRQLLAQEGLAAALHGAEQAVVAAGDRAAGQGAHDLEHLGGVLLVANQPAEGPQGGQRLKPLGPEAIGKVEIGGDGHAAVLPEAA